jgi:hypothetical protein
MKYKIVNVADIQTGFQFRKKLEPDSAGDRAVIQIRDFDSELKLNSTELTRVTLGKVAEGNYINKGDVLFLARGYKNWAALIDEELQSTVAVSHFFVIRPKRDMVLPSYLAWYINQTPAQEFLHSQARRGTHMPLIPISAFRDTPIEVPSIKIQKAIVAVSELAEKEQKLFVALQIKRAQVISAICLKASKAKKENNQ